MLAPIMSLLALFFIAGCSGQQVKNSKEVYRQPSDIDVIIISNDPGIKVIKQTPANSDSELKRLLAPAPPPPQSERIEGIYIERQGQYSHAQDGYAHDSIAPITAVKSSFELTPDTSKTSFQSKRVEGILIEGQEPDSGENIEW